MKRILMVLMALALMLAGTALAETAEPQTGFSGIWVCDRANMIVIDEDDGYRVHIEWADSAWENTEWDYGCVLADGALVSTPFGLCVKHVYAEDGTLISSETVYDDDVSFFTLREDGRLVWQSEKENFGQEMAFEWISAFEGAFSEDTPDADG